MYKKTRLPAVEDSNTPLEVVLRESEEAVALKENSEITLKQLSQILWATLAVTGTKDYKRSVASAGGIQPMKIFFFANRVRDLEAGLYYYFCNSEERCVHLIKKMKTSETVSYACQMIICCVYEKIKFKYRNRGIRYGNIEIGEMIQNILMQSHSVRLGAMFSTEFDKKKMEKRLGLRNKALIDFLYSDFSRRYSQYSPHWDCIPLAIACIGEKTE